MRLRVFIKTLLGLGFLGEANIHSCSPHPSTLPVVLPKSQSGTDSPLLVLASTLGDGWATEGPVLSTVCRDSVAAEVVMTGRVVDGGEEEPACGSTDHNEHQIMYTSRYHI